MFISIQSVLPRIPKAIRQYETREELISYMLTGYRELITGFDQETKKVVEDFTVKNHKLKLPERVKRIRGIMTKEHGNRVYYDGLTDSYLCPTCKKCNTCELTFTNNDHLLTFSFKEDEVCILYETEIKKDGYIQIYNDESVKSYLMYYAVFMSLLNRSLSGDQISNSMYQEAKQMMNVLYTKAHGAIILRTKALNRLDSDFLNFNIDEFSHRHYFVEST